MINTLNVHFGLLFLLHFQMCGPTNIHGVAIENLEISLNICPYYTATQQLSVRSQIRMLEMKELVNLHNLCIHHVMIPSDLNKLMAANGEETVKLDWLSISNQAKIPPFLVRCGKQPRQDNAGWVFAQVWKQMEPLLWSTPRLLAAHHNPLLVLGMVRDHRLGSGSRSEQTWRQHGGPRPPLTRTVDLGTVKETSPYPPPLGGWSAGCPAGLCVNTYNALAFPI